MALKWTASRQPRRGHREGCGTVVDSRGEAVVGEDVQIPVGGTVLTGRPHLPAVHAGAVIIADGGHGDDEARGSRLDEVVLMLKLVGLGTLMVGLLTPQDEPVRADAGSIDSLAQRLTAAAAWLHQQPRSMSSGVGYCGVGIVAAAALWSAGVPGARVEAIVSLGGRVDPADPRLAGVQAPTLLVVGGEDRRARSLHRRAQAQLRGENRLAVVEGADDLFRDPGASEDAAGLVRDWFTRHLAPSQGQTEEVSR